MRLEPLAKQTSATRDPTGLLTTVTEREGQVTPYAFDL
jgi:YD repeat-containing protein